MCVGQLNDVEVQVTNFQSDDKGLATIAGDVFDVPIRPDIVHRVVRWQLAKRRQVIDRVLREASVNTTGLSSTRFSLCCSLFVLGSQSD